MNTRCSSSVFSQNSSRHPWTSSNVKVDDKHFLKQQGLSETRRFTLDLLVYLSFLLDFTGRTTFALSTFLLEGWEEVDSELQGTLL